MVEITSGHFQCRIPQKPLSDFVSLFWYWQGHDSSGARERILPSATTELVIKLGRSRTSDAGVAGPSSRFSIIEGSQDDELLGAHFKEGGAFPFFTFPIAELHNLGSSLTEVWGDKRFQPAPLHRTFSTRNGVESKALLSGQAISTGDPGCSGSSSS